MRYTLLLPLLLTLGCSDGVTKQWVEQENAFWALQVRQVEHCQAAGGFPNLALEKAPDAIRFRKQDHGEVFKSCTFPGTGTLLWKTSPVEASKP
jgi:hypothetical protein